MPMDKGKYSYKKLIQALEKAYGSSLTDRIKNTLKIAFDGHQGQYRQTRDAKQHIPYIVHPVGTAINVIKYFSIVENISDDLDTLICTALVHDLLEDTRVEGSTIETVAGHKVYAYAVALTKPSAWIKGQSSEERNSIFLNSIEKAGATAVYVKICDNIHNLSRPASMPVNLYRKIVKKAENQYFILLEKCSLGDEFKRIYINIIEENKVNLLKEEQYEKTNLSPSSIRAAISECVTASKGKILEFHDVLEILFHSCSPDNVTLWRYKDRNCIILVHSVGTESIVGNGFATNIENADFSQMIYSHIDNNENARNFVFTIPIQTDINNRFIIALDFGERGAPPWLSIDEATMLVQFLVQRLIVSESDRRASLAEEAANLGIQLDVELASRLGVKVQELRRLHQWRKRCKQAISLVEHLISIYSMSKQGDSQLLSLVKLEARVKTVNSLLKKCEYLSICNWSEFEKIQDIAGVRVICPTQTVLRSFEEFILSSSSTSSWARLHPTLHSYNDYYKNPLESGYKAVHIILEVDTHLGELGKLSVPCEIQLRTMFQHTWATISHVTLYQESRTTRRRLNDHLSEMEQSIERCETLTEKLIYEHVDE